MGGRNTPILSEKSKLWKKIQGKMSFIAKGIRKPKNPTLSILQPFNILEIQFYYKDGRNIQMIKEALFIRKELASDRVL